MHDDPTGSTSAAPGVMSTPASADVLETQLDADTGDAPLIEQELLVEEISIDGMCGVY